MGSGTGRSCGSGGSSSSSKATSTSAALAFENMRNKLTKKDNFGGGFSFGGATKGNSLTKLAGNLLGGAKEAKPKNAAEKLQQMQTKAQIQQNSQEKLKHKMELINAGKKTSSGSSGSSGSGRRN